MIERIQTDSPKILGFRLSGTLQDEDYRSFVPQLESAISAQGAVSLLAQFDDFEGWDVHAAWDRYKLGVAHYADFERIAMVGDKKWEEWMAQLCTPCTAAEVRFFDEAEAESALAWLRAGA